MTVNVPGSFPSSQKTSMLHSASIPPSHPPASEDSVLPQAPPSHLNIPGGPSVHTEDHHGRLCHRSWKGQCWHQELGQRAGNRDVKCGEKEQRNQKKDEEDSHHAETPGSLFLLPVCLPLFVSLSLGISHLEEATLQPPHLGLLQIRH